MKDDTSDEGAEALLEREREIVRGIERGIADMKAGTVVSHDEAMRQIREVIERASRKQAWLNPLRRLALGTATLAGAAPLRHVASATLQRRATSARFASLTGEEEEEGQRASVHPMQAKRSGGGGGSQSEAARSDGGGERRPFDHT